MNWEIGVSTGTFYPFETMEYAIGSISEEGFGLVELFLQTPSEYTIIYGRRMLRMMGRTGARIHSIHLNSKDLDPFSPYKPRCRDADRLFRQSLDLADTTGTKIITWHGAQRREIESGLQPERIWDVIARWQEWAQEAEIALSLENVSSGMIRSAKDVQQIRAELPNLYFTFDTYHSVEGGSSPLDLIQAMQSRIATVHVSDFKPYGARQLVPGHGVINWPVFLQKLSKLRYGGPFMIELSHLTENSYSHALNESRAFLQDVMADLNARLRPL
ncbi:MAG: sugar phosphate isomerase/epimerase family protein [Ardenticatenaceae bacterium]